MIDAIPSWISDALNPVPCWAKGEEDSIIVKNLNNSEDYPEIMLKRIQERTRDASQINGQFFLLA